MNKLHIPAVAIARSIEGALAQRPNLALGVRAVLACVLSGVSLWLLVALGSDLGSGVFPFLFPIVIVCVWVGGMLSGILATALLALGSAYFHLPPHGWAISSTSDALGLAAFAGSGLLATWMMDSIQRSNSLTHAVVTSIADAVITVDRHCRIRFMNPQAETLTGWPAEEARKQPLPDVLKVTGVQGADINIQGITAEVMEERRTANVPTGSCVQNRSGDICAIDDSIAPVRTSGGEVCGAVLLVRDDTTRRRNEEALVEAERRYRDIFENAVVGMFQSTTDGRYLRVNRAMALMHGYEAPERMVSAVHDIREQEYVDPAQRNFFQRLLSERMEVRSFPLETRRRDGSQLSTIVNARVVRDAQGNPLFYEGTQEDVSERKRLQMQLEHAQKMEAIGRLAGGIAHDFNNVLGIISGYCQLAEEKIASDHPITKFIFQIRTAAGKATTLTKQLLAFSRQQAIHPTVVDLNKVVREISPMLDRLVGEDISILFQPSDELGLVVADPGQLEQVLMNLAVNARDAMPTGGSIRIETKNVNLDRYLAEGHPPSTPGPYVMLSFSDTGHGIDKDTLPRIFEPFFTTKEPGKGTGLGLATVYGIVKQSNGYIWVYSEVGQGTAFKIYLPQADPMPNDAQIAAETQGEGGTETILVVEDEAALLEAITAMLESSGYKTLKANSGAEAIAMIRKSPERIDLLLTDVIMPGVTGPDLFTQLRAEQPAVKVLYMSGYAGDKLMGHGARDILEKPFSKADLLSHVRAKLDDTQGGSRAAK